MIRVRIRGLTRFQASLRRLEAVQANAMAESIAVGAAAVRDAARENLPRGTGRLARSVSIDVSPDGLAATVGTDLDHGTYVEFGTRRMAARPWLHRAFVSALPALKARFAQAARDALGRR